MLLAALFVIAKNWKQMSINKYVMKQILVLTYNGMLLSNTKK